MVRPRRRRRRRRRRRKKKNGASDCLAHQLMTLSETGTHTKEREREERSVREVYNGRRDGRKVTDQARQERREERDAAR